MTQAAESIMTDPIVFDLPPAVDAAGAAALIADMIKLPQNNDINLHAAAVSAVSLGYLQILLSAFKTFPKLTVSGASAEFAKKLVSAGKRVIDLSADFRMTDLAIYQKYYGEHHARELLPLARFVLPELTPPAWKTEARLVAAPGCYPTSILLPLVPLLKAGLIAREHIVVNSFSGVSGAGRKVAEDYLFVERAESAKAYGLVKHRHLAEIEEQLAQLTGAPTVIQFNPHLAPMRRGIATTITVPAAPGATVEALYASWRSAYAGRPFVQLLASGETPDTAHVTGTNRLDMSAVFDPRTQNFVITSAEDNLMKGASGQAVQIMNLWCGFPETAGLV